MPRLKVIPPRGGGGESITSGAIKVNIGALLPTALPLPRRTYPRHHFPSRLPRVPADRTSTYHLRLRLHHIPTEPLARSPRRAEWTGWRSSLCFSGHATRALPRDMQQRVDKSSRGLMHLAGDSYTPGLPLPLFCCSSNVQSALFATTLCWMYQSHFPPWRALETERNSNVQFEKTRFVCWKCWISCPALMFFGIAYHLIYHCNIIVITALFTIIHVWILFANYMHEICIIISKRFSETG